MKYDYEESMKKMFRTTNLPREDLNQRILEESRKISRNKSKKYFVIRKSVIYAALAVMVIFLCGVGVSYASGISPIRVAIDIFTQRDESAIEKVEKDGSTQDGATHQLILDEYYLDVLGNGYMTFSFMRSDGSKETQLSYLLDAYYIEAENGLTKKFSSYNIRSIYSEHNRYLTGFQLSFEGSSFIETGESIVIKVGSDSFTFSDLKVSQSHYYVWKFDEGSVYLSGSGLKLEGNTEVKQYFIDSLEKTGKIAVITYKDGRKDDLQLNLYCGHDERNAALVQFSPCTQLEKHIREGWTWEQLKEEWKYNFSLYMFDLEEVSGLELGDIKLDIENAEYH